MIHDLLITDFKHPLFQKAFIQYFAELGINVTDWNSLWEEMNSDGSLAYLRIMRINEDSKIVGFIQLQPSKMTHWFFEETVGFIREFWISPEYRSQGHGSQLLRLAEKYLTDLCGVSRYILTTDTAESFYLKNGYTKRSKITAKNKYDVFVKDI